MRKHRMKPDAYMKLYLGAWLQDTLNLDATATGAYFLLIMAHWGKPGVPNSDHGLRTICRVNPQDWARVKGELSALISDTGTLWVSKRCVEEYNEAVELYRDRVSRMEAARKNNPNINPDINPDASKLSTQISGQHISGYGSSEDGVGVQGEGYHADSRTVLHILNESTGKHFRETSANLGFISARLRESGVDLAGVRLMIARQCKLWAGTSQAEYLRPETLFNKTKFDGYYAAKEQPIHVNSSPQPNPRNVGVAPRPPGQPTCGEASRRLIERKRLADEARETARLGGQVAAAGITAPQG